MLNATIIGCGDIGLRVGTRLQQLGYSVTAVVRSNESAEQLMTQGFEAVCRDLDQPNLTLPPITPASLLFYFAPPTTAGEHDLRMTHFLRSLAAKSTQPARIVYISTTAVYADSKGDWIDEHTAPQPANARGRRRLDAERQLLEFQCQQPATAISILRVAGIYRANRLPFRQLKAGQPVLALSIAPCSNRIHAEDLARICIAAALNTTQPLAIFNVSDGNPGSISQYFQAVAETFNLPPAPEISWREAQAQLSPAMLSYLKESKRIDSRRLATELGITLHYPTLEAGLRQCVEELKDGESSGG